MMMWKIDENCIFIFQENKISNIFSFFRFLILFFLLSGLIRKFSLFWQIFHCTLLFGIRWRWLWAPGHADALVANGLVAVC
jgi:uncharacterized membrane protein YfhO